jgi:hypothetical protein
MVITVVVGKRLSSFGGAQFDYSKGCFYRMPCSDTLLVLCRKNHKNVNNAFRFGFKYSTASGYFIPYFSTKCLVIKGGSWLVPHGV